MSDWKQACSECMHLLRSGDGGQVWHCAVVRTGRNPVYAVTARAAPWRGRHPTMGKCGPTARLFQAHKEPSA